MVILDVGFVFGETVVDGCVVWMILIVVLVGWVVEAGAGVEEGLFAIGFFLWVVDSVGTLVGFALVDTVIDGWVDWTIAVAVECATPRNMKFFKLN